jgi:alcohol dehydrogenase (NADP+)
LAPLDIPALGFGTWQLKGEKCRKGVTAALRAGFRHIDTAAVYENEDVIGQVLAPVLAKAAAPSSAPAPVAASGESAEAKPEPPLPVLKREDLWITTKLWNTHHEEEHVHEACEESLRKLGLDYVDLYLMHWPLAFSYNNSGDRYPNSGKSIPVPLHETWHAMEKLVQKGLTRYIGVSNFGITQIAELLRNPQTTIRPAVNQIELHPFLNQSKLVAYCQKKGILVQGYCPLGGSRTSPSTPSLLAHPTVVAIAETHSTQPAAVLLRWQLQQGFSTIPRSQNEQHIYQNFHSLQNFALSPEEMQTLADLNSNYRFVVPSWFSFEI